MKKTIDWPGVEYAYRAGIKSLRTIGAEFHTAESSIRKRADRDGWSRDLSAKIRSKADELVRKEEARKRVRTESTPSEREQIDANANLQAFVMREHRQFLAKARGLVHQLLTELEFVGNNFELFERLIDDGSEDMAQDKRLETLAKVLSIPSRVDSLKKLVESLRVVVQTEREVFGIKEENKGGDLLDALRELHGP